MTKSLKSTHYQFASQTGKYTGKVRDVYEFGDRLAMVATDRISAFDVILPEAIPYKGQVLNQIASKFLKATEDIIPNWVESVPDPNVTIGKRCKPFAIEMVIRGYLSGHAWREYREGKRMICGMPMPDDMKESDRFPEPIITPSTKASEGHDEDISRQEILTQAIVSESHYLQLEDYTRRLFARGTKIAEDRGLILVDTKYEFGLYHDQIYLIDEVHTPDSSRYFYAETYAELQEKNEPQRQLSKEFVRLWLISEGYQGKEGQQIPEMTEEKVKAISDRYIELFEQITGENFERIPLGDISERIKKNIENSINLQQAP